MEKGTEARSMSAVFDSPEALRGVIEELHRSGIFPTFALSPFPVDGVAELLARKEPKVIPIACTIAGVLGACGGYFLQYYASAVGYPVNIGGRPLNSVPTFIPVTFETMVLAAGVTAFVAWLVLSKIPRLHHRIFDIPLTQHASERDFVVVVEEYGTEREKLARIISKHNPRQVHEF